MLIFFTAHANKLTMKNSGEAELKMIEVPAGNQSVDMHIASYIGYLAGQHKGKNVRIAVISNDTDFDHVIRFWKLKSGLNIYRQQAIREENTKKAAVQSAAAKLTAKTAAVVSGTDKTRLNSEIFQTLSKAGYGTISGEIASIVFSHLGDKNFSTAVRTGLKKNYKDYDRIIGFLVPVMKKFGLSVNLTADGKSAAQTDTVKTAIKEASKLPADERTKLNNAIIQTLSKAGYGTTSGKIASIVLSHLGEKDFSAVVKTELKQKYTDHARIFTLIAPVIENAEKSSPDAAANNIRQILIQSGEKKDAADYAASLMAKYAGVKDRKQKIYHDLTAKYGQGKGLSLYTKIKKHISA